MFEFLNESSQAHSRRLRTDRHMATCNNGICTRQTSKLANFAQTFSLFASLVMHTHTHKHIYAQTLVQQAVQFLKLHIFADLYA